MVTILERVQRCRCRYCHREMTCSAMAFAENPFCSACLDERIAKAVEERGPIKRRILEALQAQAAKDAASAN